MLVGSSAGSWRFTLAAQCYLVTKLAVDVASAAKSGSDAKLHRSIVAVTLVLNGNRHSNMMFTLTTVIYVSHGKGWPNLLRNLHCSLQVIRPWHMYEGLQLR